MEPNTYDYISSKLSGDTNAAGPQGTLVTEFTFFSISPN